MDKLQLNESDYEAIKSSFDLDKSIARKRVVMWSSDRSYSSNAIDTGKIVSTEFGITSPDYVALFDDVETQPGERSDRT